MAYFRNLSSPETYEAFSRSERTITGFRIRHKNVAQRVKPGDRFLCYMTKLSRWIGIMEVVKGPYVDHTPRYYKIDDPFVVRFQVKTIAWLEKEFAIPIHEDAVWNHLSFTKGHDKKSSTWTGKIRSSLNRLDDADAQFLEKLIFKQVTEGKEYPVDEQEYQKLVVHRVRRLDKEVSVSVPEEVKEEKPNGAPIPHEVEIRESIRMQALVADLGTKIGLKIWVPKGDRARVLEAMTAEAPKLLDILPLNYDDTTLKTIEQIDVLWLKGRSIARAFEIEHTTSVYSGILRMADLLALQPNMDINLHIVAPNDRRERVFSEIRRPVFSLLDRGPLSENCTFISYDSLRELSELPHLTHVSDSVLDEYAEEAE